MAEAQQNFAGHFAQRAPAAPGVRMPESFVEPEAMVAVSLAMRETLEVVRRSAPTEVPVLIYGEPDTGKKRIARELHRQSRRAARPLVHVVSNGFRESELAEKLFGDRESVAAADRPATSPLLAKAHGGTVFLEDVSQLPLWAQVRLLDVLQQGRHFRGAGQPGGLDVRVIASTTEDLREAVVRHAFSSSLYYFLKVVEIHIPPLRHRPQDIGPLAQRYLQIANATRTQSGKPACRFAPDALEHLMQYDWPGNTLQLASVVAHAALLTDGDEIAPVQIAALFGEAAPRENPDTIPVPLVGGLREIQHAVVMAVIGRCRGNKAAAARALKLHRRELYRILQGKAEAKEPAPLLPSLPAPPNRRILAGGLYVER